MSRLIALCAAFALTTVTAPALARAATPLEIEAIDAAKSRKLYLITIEKIAKERPLAALAYLDDYDRRYKGDPKASLLRADCLMRVDERTAAEQVYRALLSGGRGKLADVDQGAAWAGLGRVLAARGQWVEAVSALSDAVAKQPVNTSFISDLGYAQMMAGDARGAVFRLRQARELAPQDGVARNNLILALWAAGETREAEQMLQALPDPDERQELRGQIARRSVGGLTAASPLTDADLKRPLGAGK
jgi:Flp pilus assembly protein TadD